MVDPDLVRGVKDELNKGATVDSLTRAMIKAGYEEKEINAAFELATSDKAQPVKSDGIPKPNLVTKTPAKKEEKKNGKKWLLIIGGILLLLFLGFLFLVALAFVGYFLIGSTTLMP